MKASKLLVVGSSLMMLMVGACSSDDSKSNNGTTNNGVVNNGATNNGSTNNGAVEYTYYEHVAPVLEGRCTSCHTDGGIGPFPLESYGDAQPIATLLASVVEEKTMPPFLPTGECNEFQHDPRLTGEQIDAIVAGLRGGRLKVIQPKREHHCRS